MNELNLPKNILDVVSDFAKIPGIGEKTALRYTLHLTEWSEHDVNQFSNHIGAISTIGRCAECGMFSESSTCAICLNARRLAAASLCVVENIVDYMAIERSQNYQGVYHILGGVLNPLRGVGPDDLRISSLLDRISRCQIKEVVLAINPSVEGDATCAYLKQVLPQEVPVERLGFGIPIWGSLEYLDAMTITKAFENKRSI